MRNKQRVYVSIMHRGGLSLGDNRARLKNEAFHWGIMISPKNSTGPTSLAFDVSDAALPNCDWTFRSKKQVDPDSDARLVGRVLIGKVPNKITDEQIHSILAAVPLPVKGSMPNQSCVTWTLAAIEALQDAGLARRFDVSQFVAWAFEYAVRCLDAPSPQNEHDYAVGSQ